MEGLRKRKRSDHASGHPRRPSPESDDGQPEEETYLSTPEEQHDDGQPEEETFPSTSNAQHDDGQPEGEIIPPTTDGQPGTSIGQGPFISQEDCRAFLREVEEYFKDVEQGKYESFMNLMIAQKNVPGRIGYPCLISQVKELFRGHTEVLKLFDEILPPGFNILFAEDMPEIQDLANLYMAKVNTRSETLYTTFIHILFLYNERALTSDQVDQEVEHLFAESCDLLEEYDYFQPDRAAPVVQSPLHPRHSALEVSEHEREQQRERIQRMCEDVAKRKRKEKGKGVVTERNQQQQPKRVSARLANAANALRNRRSSRSSAEAHPRRSIRRAGATPAAKTRSRSRSRSRCLDDAENSGLSMCNPSYQLLKPPKNGEEVPVHRSELAKSVLNEECELVWSDDSKERIWNPHEKVLLTCEADQYECDMVWIKLEGTANNLMNYLLKLQRSNNKELPPVEKFLLAEHKRCIQKLYDCDAEAIMVAMKEDPARALPVVLKRVVIKLEELRSFTATIKPMWSQVYRNNFQLSLDHRSVDSRPVDRRSKVKLKNVNKLEASTSGSASPSRSAGPSGSTSPRRSGSEGSETNIAGKMLSNSVSESSSDSDREE